MMDVATLSRPLLCLPSFLKPLGFLASTIFVLEVIIISQEDHANQLI